MATGDGRAYEAVCNSYESNGCKIGIEDSQLGILNQGNVSNTLESDRIHRDRASSDI